MDKKDIIKIFVVAIVVLFVAEMAAIGFSMSSSNGSGTGKKGESGRGIIEVNATIEAYEPQLMVVGEGNALEAAISGMKGRGEIVNDTTNEQGIRVLGLSFGSDVRESARLLEKANASVSAPAILSIPQQVEVKTPSATFEASGGSLRYPIKPDVDVGGQVLFGAIVNVKDGQIDTFESIRVSTSETAKATVSAQFENVAKGKFVVLVPWESRRIDKAALLLALREQDANATLSYEEKSYAVPQTPLDAQQVGAIESGPAYIASVSPAVISIAKDFVDSQTLVAGLSSIGVQVQLPASVITVSFAPQANGTEANGTGANYPEGLIYAALNNTNLSALSIEPAKSYKIVLPETFSSGGTTYEVGANLGEFEMPLNVTQESGIVSLELEFEHIGTVMSVLKSARQVS